MTEQKKPDICIYADSKPFFSIIMPVYNAADFLRECLESILAQDFQDWEAILVDDGSSDDSVAVAAEFTKSDKRFRIYTSERNSGGCHAPRMRGASLANGKYIVTIDADDKVSPDLLKAHFEHILQLNPDLVIPEMWKLIGNEAKKILPNENIQTSIIWNGKDLVAHTLCQWDIPMAGFAVRRDIYLEADRKLTEKDRKSCFVDEYLSRWLLFLSSKVYFSKARYYYRQNSQSVTSVNTLRLIEGMSMVCDSLIGMTSENFGESSPTHIRALENKLFTAVGFLRLINNGAASGPKEKKASLMSISASLKGFDLSQLKGKTNPRYLALMRLPVPAARIALKIFDKILRK